MTAGVVWGKSTIELILHNVRANRQDRQLLTLGTVKLAPAGFVRLSDLLGLVAEGEER